MKIIGEIVNGSQDKKLNPLLNGAGANAQSAEAKLRQTATSIASRSNPTNSSRVKEIDSFFDTMTQMYGHRFTSAWGSEDSGVWQKIIFSFSTFIVTEALCFLLNKDHPFMEFPPNPMQFRKLCEQIKAEHAPRKTSKLTSPCDVCGQPGRIPSDPNSKSTKALCYQHYCESRFPMKKELSQWWKDFYKTWTLDKSEIRKILEARNYKSDIEREIENLYHYHKLKVNQAEESVKQAKHNYENG